MGTVMPKAFVLINVESGAEEEVLQEVKNTPGVEEAYYSYGVYDIIAKIGAETMEKLREVHKGASPREKEDIRRKLSIVALTDRSADVKEKASEMIEELKSRS